MRATMIDNPFTTGSGRLGAWTGWLLTCLGTSFVVLLAVHGGSFWIDEFCTADFASQPTLRAWRHEMRTTPFAEAQMPFYLFFMWCWEKVCGSGELSLRLAAAPWLVSGVVAYGCAVRRLWRTSAPIVLIVITSPFIWYYLNEARLYTMQLGAASMVFAALIALSSIAGDDSAEHRWLLIGAFGVLLLSAISIIGMIWAAAALVVVLALFPWVEIKKWGRQRRILWCALAVLLFLLGLYYLGTVLRGARATNVGTTNWQTIMFIFYEQLGFSGLGPGRLELREQGMRALKPFLLLLISFAALLAAVYGVGLRTLCRAGGAGRFWRVVASLGIPTAFLLVTGLISHFRVLGRHFAPLLTVLLFVAASGVRVLWKRGGGWRFVVVSFLGLSAISCLQIRFAARHAKDDYRGAAHFAGQALLRGEKVWWNADPGGPKYYGLPIGNGAGTEGTIVVVNNLAAGELPGGTPPEWILVSKTDTYDQRGTVQRYLNNGGYHAATNLAAFVIWQRNSGEVPAH